MNKTENIDALFDRCKVAMANHGYSDESILRTQKLFLRGIRTEMSSIGQTDFSPALGMEYLSKLEECGNPFAYRQHRRVVLLLCDFMETGRIKSSYRLKPKNPFPLEGKIGELCERFIEDGTIRMRWKRNTIESHRRQLSLFVKSLEIKGVININDVTESIVAEIIDRTTNKAHLSYSLRSAFRFFKDNGIVDDDFGEILRYRNRRGEIKVPSVYTPDEIKVIEESVCQTDPIGIRDYAMLLLATRLGMRSSDIRMLKLANIDWQDNRIVISQFKTGKEIELPLLNDVGEALVNYLVNVRPKISNPYVFVALTSPYRPFSRVGITIRFQKIVRDSKIKIGDRHFGAHSMRHSLATNMLSKGISLPVISDILGHYSTETTMSYLRVSTDLLKTIALEVPPVDEAFYEQKGGEFYV